MTFAEALTSAEEQYQSQMATYAPPYRRSAWRSSSATQRGHGQLASASPSSGSAATWFTGRSVRMLDLPQ